MQAVQVAGRKARRPAASHTTRARAELPSMGDGPGSLASGAAAAKVDAAADADAAAAATSPAADGKVWLPWPVPRRWYTLASVT